jgi:hydrogenase nickel incorporation protein HypA/HybF
MHEWALAEAVVAAVEGVVRENGGQTVRSVTVGIGELQCIAMDAFQEGLREALRRCEPAPAGMAEELFRFEIEPAAFRCNRCGREWPLREHEGIGEEELEAIHFMPETAHVYLRCPGCASPDFLLTRGRGVTIRSVELETES